MKRISFLFSFIVVAGLLCGAVRAGEVGPYTVARKAIDPQVADKVISITGKGTPHEVNQWYILFEDPSSKTGARVVTVRDDHIDKVFPADSRPQENGVFNPAQVNVPVGKALSAAGKYAEVNGIHYDSVRVLLRPGSDGKPPFWRVELREDGQSRGSVYTKAIDGTFSRYEPASGHHHRVKHGGGGFDDAL